SPQDQHAFAAFYEVANDGDGSEYRAPDATCEAHNLARPITDRRNTVEGSLNTCAIVITKVTDSLGDHREILTGNIDIANDRFFVLESCFRWSAKIHHDLDELAVLRMLFV